MEGFDFSALLQNHGKQHKSRPVQFTSVANGVKKRLETTLKRRRSSRLTIFDRIRNLPQNIPAPKPNKAEEIKQKAEHRKMQLEKWKEEKEKKKKEAAAQKKKPFIVGLARSPPKLGPPQKVMPSTSGRVTRAQTAKNKAQNIKKNNSPVRSKKSFAPEHASFCPPLIKGIKEMPVLDWPKKKGKVTMVQFKPVITEVETTKKSQSKSKPNNILKTNTNKDNVHNKVSNKLDAVVREVVQGKVNSPRMTRNKTQEKNKVISQSRALTVESSHSDDSDPVRLKTKGNLKETKVLQYRGKTVTKYKSIVSSPSDTPESPVETNALINTKTKLHDRRSSRLNNRPISINSSSSDDSTDSPAVESKTRKSINIVTKPSTKGDICASTSGSTVGTKKKSIRKSMKACDISGPFVLIKPSNISCIQIDSTNSESSLGSPLVKRTSRKSLTSPKCTPLKNNIKKTPSKPIPNSESSSEERLRSPKDVPMTPEQITELANQISPCITLSRGKDNARREMQKKLRQGLLDEHLQTLDTVDHFHRQLSLETNRLTEMADHWEKMLEQNTLPEIVQEAILTAVGQARLLMSQKFQQFAGLVDRCEAADPAHPLVTPADLQGFWDMVYMQVENLDVRFKKLEEMQARGWKAEEQQAERRRKVPAKPKSSRPAPPSRIRDMIAAARKAKKAPEAEGKTFEAGFFCVQSPVRSPAPPTPSRPPSLPSTPCRPPTLLKAVLSNEANKASASKSAASYAMLRASMIGKNVEQDTDASVNFIQFTPVNLQATPGRSILKSSSVKNKSVKMVLFDSSDTNILDSSLDKDISGVQKLDSVESADSEKENLPDDLTELPIEKENCQELTELSVEKENEPKKNNKQKTGKSKKLVRQIAVSSPIKTRNRRKTMESLDNEVKVLQESVVNTVATPRRSMRRKTVTADA